MRTIYCLSTIRYILTIHGSEVVAVLQNFPVDTQHTTICPCIILLNAIRYGMADNINMSTIRDSFSRNEYDSSIRATGGHAEVIVGSVWMCFTVNTIACPPRTRGIRIVCVVKNVEATATAIRLVTGCNPYTAIRQLYTFRLIRIVIIGMKHEVGPGISQNRPLNGTQIIRRNVICIDNSHTIDCYQCTVDTVYIPLFDDLAHAHITARGE